MSPIKDPIAFGNSDAGCKPGKSAGSTLKTDEGLGCRQRQMRQELGSHLPAGSCSEINIDELAQWIFGYTRRQGEAEKVLPPRPETEYVRHRKGYFGRGCRRKRRKIKAVKRRLTTERQISWPLVELVFHGKRIPISAVWMDSVIRKYIKVPAEQIISHSFYIYKIRRVLPLRL